MRISQILHIRIVLFFSSMLFLFLASCHTTKTVEAPPAKPGNVPPPVTKNEPVKEVPVTKKDEDVIFKVVLIFPFGLNENFAETEDENAEPSIHPGSLNALNFYEGSLLAADSLKLEHKTVKMKTYETPADSSGVVRLFNDPSVKEAAVVIGNFPNNLTNAAVKSAKQSGVKFILTQSGTPTALEDNKNVALAYASTITQCREMAAFMLRNQSDAKVILVYRTTKREEELANVFRQEIQKIKKYDEYVELNATSKSYKDITGLLSKTKRNIVFLVSSDEAFVNPVISLIEEQNIFGINVVGLPTWQNFESIDFMSLKNLQVHVFDNNFISMEASDKIAFRKKFINAYSNDPLNSAYNGFDLIYNLGLSYRLSENNFSDWIQKSFRNGNSSYNFQQINGGGMENKSIAVLKFSEYKLERLNSK